jgi:hypothetical protein
MAAKTFSGRVYPRAGGALVTERAVAANVPEIDQPHHRASGATFDIAEGELINRRIRLPNPSPREHHGKNGTTDHGEGRHGDGLSGSREPCVERDPLVAPEKSNPRAKPSPPFSDGGTTA